jgi:hypothetical protein
VITIIGDIPTADVFAASSPGTVSSSPASSSFASQLAAAVQQAPASSITGSPMGIGSGTVPGQKSDGRQISAGPMVVRDASQPSGNPSPATQMAASQLSIPPAPGTESEPLPETLVPFFQSLIKGSTRTPAAYADTVEGAAALAPKKPLTAAQAYWAQQPPEIQALQQESDPQARVAQAMKLADQGFTIDVPIMAWGWNPLTTMQLRQADGYTWVPSGMQQPVSVTPGYQVAGLPSYDPKSPPPGSIAVTTDFAKGTIDDPALSSSTGAVTT